MNRILKKSLISVIAATALVGNVFANDIHILTLNDGDYNCTTGVCSFRNAIAESNNGDTIVFDVNGTFNILNTLNITKNLTIKGNGVSQTILNGNDIVSGFSISNGSTVSISDITVTGNNAIGISNDGNLTLKNSEIKDNNINTSPAGIGIHNDGTLTIEKTTISGNNGWHGGGVFNSSSGVAKVIESEIINNDVSCIGGGGIHNEGTLTIEKSTFYGNSTDEQGGGAIYNQGSGSLDIKNSTFYQNSASTSSGGAIYGNNSSDINISHSTIYANNADSGGGIYSGGSQVVNIKNSILANNISGNGNAVIQSNCSGTIISTDYNLINDTTGCTVTGVTTNNIIGGSPSLETFQNNGGYTNTLSLLENSPAIGAGVCTDLNLALVTTDQRGYFRSDTSCDIGAYDTTATQTDPNSSEILLNLSDYNSSEHNITTIQYIGQTDGNKTIITNEETNLSIPIDVSSTAFSLKFNLDDNSSSYWYNFVDGKLYEDYSLTSNFIHTINKDNNTITIDVDNQYWIETNTTNSIPTIDLVYDRYRLKDFSSFDINLNIDDQELDHLTVSVTLLNNNNIIDDTNLRIPQTYTSSQYKDIPIKLPISKHSQNNIGVVRCTIAVVDQNNNTTYRNFNIVISDYLLTEFKTLNNDYNTTTALPLTNTKIFSAQYDIHNKYLLGINNFIINSYDFNSGVILNNQAIDINGSLVLNSLSSNYYTTDENNIISIYSDSSLTGMVKQIKYVQEYSNTELSSITNFTYSDPNSKGYLVYEKYNTDNLELYQNVIYYGIAYDSLDSFTSAFQKDNNSMGIVRRDIDNKSMLFLDNNTSTGNLLEIDENGTIITSSAGTWEKTTISDIYTLVLYPSVNNYNYGTAFAKIDSSIKRGQFFKKDDVTSTIYFNNTAMKEFRDHYAPTPKITKGLNNGWTYISLPTTMTLCDSSIQSLLQNICDKTNNLDTIFGTNSNIKYLLKYTSDWSYWDNTGVINSYYQLDRFSSISNTEGLLVKTDANTTIDLPYDMFNNNTNDFIALHQDGWILSSTSEDKTVQEVKTMVESQSKTLKYILVLRDTWEVYAPYNDTSVDQNLPRISEVKKDESFWILVE